MRKARPDGWIGPFDLSVFLVNSLTVIHSLVGGRKTDCNFCKSHEDKAVCHK